MRKHRSAARVRDGRGFGGFTLRRVKRYDAKGRFLHVAHQLAARPARRKPGARNGIANSRRPRLAATSSASPGPMMSTSTRSNSTAGRYETQFPAALGASLSGSAAVRWTRLKSASVGPSLERCASAQPMDGGLALDACEGAAR